MNDFIRVKQALDLNVIIPAESGFKVAPGKSHLEECPLCSGHDCFSIHEMLIYEDLGWSPRGKAKEDIEAGAFTHEGDLPVNTDGGLKCFGHPLGASGLRMLYEVYKQLQEKAGPRQVKNPHLGLTHNLGGIVPGACIGACSIVGN